MCQLGLVTYASLVLIIGGNGLYAPALESLRDPHIHILICVDF